MTERLTYGFKRLVTRLSVSPFRLFAYVLHATGLERIYKPRFVRQSALFELTDEVVAKLPKHCQTITGAQMDPMNLIFVGDEADLRLIFKTAEWSRANPASPIHLLYGLLSAVTKRPYKTGPFTPFFINIGLQDYAYQQASRSGNFRQRHHLRIWRTGIVLPGDKRVWVGAASFDIKLKVQLTPPFIHHGIDPNIDKERDFVVRSLEDKGALRLKSVAMTPAVMAHKTRSNAYGSKYFTDGRAVVVVV